MLRLFSIFVFAWLSACAPKPFNWNTNDYTVKRGDTLYSIAWRFELDPDDLVRWNHLSNSSLIHPGQRLHTTRPRANKSTSGNSWSSPPPVMRSPKIKTVVVKKYETLYSIARKHQLSVQQLARYNNLKKPYVLQPGQKLKLSATSTLASSNHRQVKSSQSKISGSVKAINWKWPIKGKIIKSFNRRLNDAKGIDIAGVVGKSIKAAASGKVVYSGNGLISYGNLIIIKHNQHYLSAYAHNRKLLVKEGQKVKVGQIIAELGKTGAKNPRLHFEIRKNGKPVNPVRYLPSS